MRARRPHSDSHAQTRSQGHWLTDAGLKLHSVLADVFADFEQADVTWCCLRLPSNLCAPESDIDLLIDPADFARVPPLLLARKFVRIPLRGRSSHWLCYHRPTAQWLWLHCTTELSFGPGYQWKTKAEAGCLNRRHWKGPLAILGPDDAFWALLLHVLLDKDAIQLHHQESLQAIAAYAKVDGPLGRIVETACPPGWTPAQIVHCASTGAWEALETLAPALKAKVIPRPSVGVQGVFRRGQRALADLLSLRWWQRRGLSVALLGPDGAGKSTLADGLKGSSVFPVRLVYMGLTGGALPYIDFLLLPGLVQLGRIGVLWSRYLRGLYHQVRGRLVVFDRYIYDAMTPHPERLNWYRRATRWIDGHTCPGPDLVLVLNAPGQVMYERKREYTPDMLEDWRQHFLALQDWLPQVELVDTTRTAEEVCADAMDQIWQRYAARLTEYYSSRDWKKNNGGVSA
jgi:hypothetical protein